MIDIKSVFDRDLELRAKSKNKIIKIGKKMINMTKIDDYKQKIIDVLNNDFSITDTKKLVDACGYLNSFLQASININGFSMNIIIDDLSSQVDKAFKSIIIT